MLWGGVMGVGEEGGQNRGRQDERGGRAPGQVSPARRGAGPDGPVVAAGGAEETAATVLSGIIGTAGHVDHGKTALVRALTGTETDRLPEEQRRGISIELGFAEIALPGGRRAGLVDVPGHERFVKQMVAGATGIDLLLLVVAADEGVMPQTREHLDIACLLGVTRGVVALTKSDLVEASWLELVAEDVRALLAPTPLRAAPLIPVSAKSGAGLEALRAALAQGLVGGEAHQDRGFVRLPVDRVFSVAGFGTVVTGTLTSGTLAPEDRLERLPARVPVRVRGVQVHGHSVPRAQAGQRVAVNLGGVDRDEVARGDVLATPGTLDGQIWLAVRLHAIPRRARDVRHGIRVHVHVGTAEAVGRLRLLEGSDGRMPESGSGLATLHLERPLAVGRGDRFILRAYSPVATIGGGTVLDVGRRYTARVAAGLEALAVLERGDPAEVVLSATRAAGPLTLRDVVQRAGLPAAEVETAVQGLVADGRLLTMTAGDLASGGPSGGIAPPVESPPAEARPAGTVGQRAALPSGALLIAAAAWADLRERIRAQVAAYHQHYPLRPGMPREALRQGALAGLDARALAVVLARLAADGMVRQDGEHVALPAFAPDLPPAWSDAAQRVCAALVTADLQPPATTDLLSASGFTGSAAERAEFLAHLAGTGRIARVGDMCFAPGALARAAEVVRGHLRAHGLITVAQLRDLLGVTRKHAVPIAEYLDGARITRREGDVRRLA